MGNGAGGKRHYLTHELARAAGTHENTVRLYVEWGFLAEPGRGPNGYRRWTAEHLDQMVFARLALHGTWPGKRIRESALALARRAAAGDLAGALGDAEAHARLVCEERGRAEAAAEFLERWARGEAVAAGEDEYFSPREAALAVGATPGQIRNWERNRLVGTPRDPATGHRAYGPEEVGRLRIIRILLLAGYSVAAILRMVGELDRGRKGGLKEALNTPRPEEEVFTAFDSWLDSLAEQGRRADRMIAMLRDMIGKRAGRTLQ